MTRKPATKRAPRNQTSARGALAAKVYSVLEQAAKKGMALNLNEIARGLGKPKSQAKKGLESLLKNGLAHVVGKDSVGNVYFPGAEQKGLFENPSPGERIHGEHATAEQRKALAVSHKKALAWFRKNSLVDEPELCEWEPPESFINVGMIESIGYSSDKFDAKTRSYIHEVTQKRRLFLSTDGSTILVFPPFRITTRGIEG